MLTVSSGSDEGKYSVNVGMASISTCLPCAAGKYANPGNGQSTACQNCTAGKYNNLEQQLVIGCKSCIEGTYAVGGGNPLCTPCERGKYANPGSGQSTACKDCGAGKHNNLEQQLVVGCKSCIGGRYVVGVGNPVCTNCTAGKLSEAGVEQVSESVCKVCVAGLYSDLAGSTLCKACPMGKNLIEEGTASDHDSEIDWYVVSISQYLFVWFLFFFLQTLFSQKYISRSRFKKHHF